MRTTLCAEHVTLRKEKRCAGVWRQKISLRLLHLGIRAQRDAREDHQRERCRNAQHQREIFRFW
jgi:hypothetical protein